MKMSWISFLLANMNKSRPPSSYYPGELKNIVIEDVTPSNGFPPPPSPTTLHRSTPPVVTSPHRTPTTMDPRLDTNFSSVIAQRAAEAKARRHENPTGLEFNSNGLPPSTTFFNNCVTTNGVHQSSTPNGKLSQFNLSNKIIFSAIYHHRYRN